MVPLSSFVTLTLPLALCDLAVRHTHAPVLIRSQSRTVGPGPASIPLLVSRFFPLLRSSLSFFSFSFRLLFFFSLCFSHAEASSTKVVDASAPHTPPSPTCILHVHAYRPLLHDTSKLWWLTSDVREVFWSLAHFFALS